MMTVRLRLTQLVADIRYRVFRTRCCCDDWASRCAAARLSTSGGAQPSHEWRLLRIENQFGQVPRRRIREWPPRALVHAWMDAPKPVRQERPRKFGRVSGCDAEAHLSRRIC